MSRQEVQPENQFVLKRARQEDRLIQHSRSSSIPSRIVSNVNAFDMSPFIRGFQDNMSNWMSSLIQHRPFLFCYRGGGAEGQFYPRGADLRTSCERCQGTVCLDGSALHSLGNTGGCTHGVFLTSKKQGRCP